MFHGVSAADFEIHYWPACRRIVIDNRVGKVMFATNTIMKNSRLMRRAMLRMSQREQSRAGSKPHMSSLLWNMFTGSAPYTEMFRGTLHPGFVLNLLASLGGSLWPGARRVSRREKVA